MSGNPLAGKDILSAGQFSREVLDLVFAEAAKLKPAVAEHGSLDVLSDKIMVNLFYEPSTRTSASFAAAMLRLGGKVFPITEVKNTSVSKGETLADTVKVLEQYADVLVLRHPDVGSAKEAADAASVPLINAGDGSGEHPTQALLDLFTIGEELGKVDGLTVTFVGDLKYGRTVHSLARLLDLYDVRLRLVSPQSLAMPAEVTDRLKIPHEQSESLEDVLADTDVLYVTRVQQERFADAAEYEKVKGSYVIDPELLEKAKRDCVVMHPLPRVDEIDQRVDADPRAAYFREVRNGMIVRMALLKLVLDRAG